MRRSLRLFSSASAKIGFIGIGERAQSVVERVALRSGPRTERFSYLSLTDDARSRASGLGASSAPGEEAATEALVVPLHTVPPQLREEDHGEQIDRELGDADSPLASALAPAAASDVVFVISDLGDALPNGGAPSVCRHLAQHGVLTLSVAILPFSFGGHVLNERARRALRRLKNVSDVVFVIDSGTLRAQDLHTANFFELHERFLDGVASNLHALCAPLIRPSDLRKITLMHWRQVFRRDEAGRGQEARLVTARATVEDKTGRGEALVQAALTDPMYPVNDVSVANAALVAVEASKDLSFGEIEEVYDLQRFLQRDAILVQGLHYADDLVGIQMTLAVVGGTILTPEELQLEEEELQRHAAAEEAKRASSTVTSFDAWKHAEEYWNKFKKWF